MQFVFDLNILFQSTLIILLRILRGYNNIYIQSVLYLGFTSEVKLWHISFTKTGDYKQVFEHFDILKHV